MAKRTRVFLDANVLFSAAYRAEAPLATLWHRKDCEVVTSSYALTEARRNLAEPDQQSRLDKLSQQTAVVTDAIAPVALPNSVSLPEKDVPILQAAISARATYLLTGDKSHFGKYYGKTIEGVTILPPADYLNPKNQEIEQASATQPLPQLQH